MQVEIWSDVLCPFCYIGKRNFEAALQQLPQHNAIHVVWKSFQLDPDFQTQTPPVPYAQYLQQRKGFPPAQVKELLAYVTDMAKARGLDFRFDNAVVANSLKAHQLLHFAKQHQRQDAVKEALLKAHFVEGLDIGNEDVLVAVATACGLAADEVHHTLATNVLEEEVQIDLYEAHQIGVKGVPFFVFDRKYAVSGAQPTEVFLEVLQKSIGEWQAQQPLTQTALACEIDGQC